MEYHKIGWNDYTAQLNSLVNTNQEYDIAFTWTDSYVTNAVAGAWLNLTPYLDNLGAEMYDAIDPQLWKGVTIDGSVWGVPPPTKSWPPPMHFLFSQELVDKYHIDISQYRSFASLEPLLKHIAQDEPECIPLFFDSSRLNIWSLGNYEYVTYDAIPLMVNSHDSSCQVVNIFETSYAQETLQLLHRYYQAGYINQDASLRTSFSRFQGGSRYSFACPPAGPTPPPVTPQTSATPLWPSRSLTALPPPNPLRAVSWWSTPTPNTRSSASPSSTP